MTSSPFALSLSNSFTQIGAVAAFAALVGIAVLSLLFFSQARELKRLREWAGRAPERAAEQEQRVTAAASVQAARGRSVPQQPSGGVSSARPVPRGAPINARAVSAAGPATRVAEGLAAAGAPAVPVMQGEPPTALSSDAGPNAGAAVTPDGTPPSAGAQSAGAQESSEPAAPVGTPTTAGATAPGAGVQAAPAVGPGSAADAVKDAPPSVPRSPASAAPASAKTNTPPRPTPQASAAAALTPSAAAPLAAGVSSPRPATAAAATAAAAGVVAAAAKAPARAPVPVPKRPPAPTDPPVSGSRRTAAAGVEGNVVRRSAPAPSARSPVGATPASRARRTTSAALADPRTERSPARVTALIVGGVVLGIVVLVWALTSLGGGGGSGKSATVGPPAKNAAHTGPTQHSSHGGSSSAGESTAGNSASMSVAVLNGTGTAGLAHHLSGTLKQRGYAHASALNGRPSGVHQITIVEYASGHRGDAEGVARSLGVTQVQPMEAATASLAGASTVAVIAGADEATGP